MTQTIYALASGRGRAGVAIIRVSGPQALHSLELLSGLNEPALRYAHFVKLRHHVSRETIDHALVLFFENPHSFTGEDVAEYHLHGSQAIIEEVLSCLKAQPNHRMAEPGEFTRRGFENGKMDLTEAEAINDLINAQTQLQKAQALRQLEGGLKELYSGWAARLTKTLAYLEADLEFPDEDDADGVSREVIPIIDQLMSELALHLSDNRRGEILRDGFQIAIIGAPNAGKSSLLNALAKRDVAIVSNVAGTTRDVLEVNLDLAGYPVILSDTAGIRFEELDNENDHDRIETEGIKRAIKRAEEADLKILLYDGTKEEPDPYTLSLIDEDSVSVANKSDAGIKLDCGTPLLEISAKTGDGIEKLLDVITQKIEERMGGSETISLTRVRHRASLESCYQALKRSKDAALPELMTEDVRLAIRHLGQITGRVDVEDLLDVVFRDFCIGK